MQFYSDQKSICIKEELCTEAIDKGWKHRQSAEENPQDGYNCPAARQRQTAFGA